MDHGKPPLFSLALSLAIQFPGDRQGHPAPTSGKCGFNFDVGGLQAQASMSSLTGTSTTHACCVTKVPASSDEESEKWEATITSSALSRWISDWFETSTGTIKFAHFFPLPQFRHSLHLNDIDIAVDTIAHGRPKQFGTVRIVEG
ncbi:hypothetical protein EDD22DRAFT_1051516 [Suillus occidentalis]|nr:hypothetical protein EDD22DRAFT_1051516 [Suillus occidentalis]